MNHINNKVVLGLGAAALIAVGAAAFLSGQREPELEPAPAGGFAISGLREHINGIRSLRATGAEGKSLFSLNRGDKGWTVKEKADYPADAGKLRALLMKLSDAKLLEQKTANEQRYSELGVEDTQAPDAKGVKITVEGLPRPEQLIIGNYSARSGGTFVRHPEEKRSWLAKGNLSVERDPLKWLDTRISDIPAERMTEVILTKPGGKPLRLFKERRHDVDFAVSDVPVGKQVSSPGAVKGLAATLAGLELEDALPAGQVKQPADAALHTASFRAADGLKIDVSAWQEGDKHYARFFATLEQAKAEAYVQETQAKAKADFEERQKQDATLTPPPDVADPGKDREQRLGSLAAEVAALTQRFGGWAFVIAPATYANLDKSLDDLLQPAATPTPTPTPTPAPTAASPKAAPKGKH